MDHDVKRYLHFNLKVATFLLASMVLIVVYKSDMDSTFRLMREANRVLLKAFPAFMLYVVLVTICIKIRTRRGD
ncbi:hypothetical protein RH915_08985 [Serpentinicella sp. ANB-PHB4]|uniref:hypothetical protein n=1 Tax=Serpentinicella sp. ANB-PHB4 TaxID=3074076 RepID=UPI002856C7E8|nr:hypothetical protein [Serpentinicella sp. ANB-PHB4]MDR5659628.1 hypothetical protein [Serpentinicella sp. ANB-PHB4]